MNKKNGLRAKHIDFILIDIISLVISLVISYVIRFKGIFNVYSLGDYKLFGIILFLSYIFLMLFNNYHSGILKRTYLSEMWHCIFLNVQLLLFVIAFLFIFKISANYSRMVIGMFFLIDTFVMFIFRNIRKKSIWKGYKKGKNTSNIVIISTRNRISKFWDEFTVENTGYYNCVGLILLDDNSDVKISEKLEKLIVRKDDILEFVKNNVVNEAFIIADFPEDNIYTEMFLNMGIAVNIEMNANIGDNSNTKIEKFGTYTMLSSSISAGTSGEIIIKRLMDIIVSIIGLIFTVIFTIVLTPIIKKQSPGPVFFAQDRVGKNGKIFKMYKFRSMYMDAEERKKELMDQNQMQGLMFKMDNDPRIMPIGHFIRKTSIDEFPQFWNILKGDMSLVGTRPPTLDEYKQYNPYHLSRLAIKPGLTGMWQTSGRSDITDFEEVVRLDNEYIRNFSLGMDLKIIFKTFGAVLKMKGSA